MATNPTQDQVHDPREAVQRAMTPLQRHPQVEERKTIMSDGKPAADSRISNNHKAPC